MTSFTMEAKENYDAASAALLAGNTQPAAFALDPANLACGYDFNRRALTYLGLISPDMTVGVSTGTFTNNTGFTLYDGSTLVLAPSATFTIQKNGANAATVFWPQVCQKDIDTGAVTFFSTYSSSATVPANVGCVYPYLQNIGSGYTMASVSVSGGGGTGMQAKVILEAGGGGYLANIAITNWGTGYTSAPSFSIVGDGTGASVLASVYQTPSDGTYRWVGSNFSISPRYPNGPNLINPRNGDFWTNAESCELYQFRRADDFAQIIAPAKMAIKSNPFFIPLLIPIGIDATWCYAFTNPVNEQGIKNLIDLALIPAEIQSDETAAATKLTYAIWDSAPFSPDIGARLTFGTDGDVYVLSLASTGGTNFYWRLTKFAPPVLSAYGSNAVGAMTDLTPSLWDISGPNADAANYTTPAISDDAGSLMFSLVRLPATNQMAAVLKMPKECSSDSSDYANTMFSCVYATLGASPAYDYHSAFVTGYMDAAWIPAGSIPTTGYAVVDCRETNNYLDQSDYLYAGVDYTKRWFVFQCYPILAGVVDTSNGLMSVLVQYQFVSGSAPAVVSPPGLLTDLDWDAGYADYQAAISQPFVICNSMMLGVTVAEDNNFFRSHIVYPDPGLHDPDTGAFWFSGLTSIAGTFDALAANAMFYLDPAFTARAAYNAVGQPNRDYGAITPPLLRLSFSASPEPGSARRSAKVTLRYGYLPA